MNESIYDNSNIHLVYQKSRALPDETLKLWLETINNSLSQYSIKTIVDLGCGTGRFTKGLSDYFSAKVYGIDPSSRMLSVARESINSPLIEFIEGNAEDIPLNDNSADLIFVSQVFHLIKDKYKAVMEIERVLSSKGFFCMRVSPVESMDSYLYPDFFPAAKEIDMKRLLLRNDITEMFTKNGFELILHDIIHQKFAQNHKEYYEKIKMRGTSDLSIISDEEFYKGLKRLRKYCYGQKSEEPVFEDVDLFIFRVK